MNDSAVAVILVAPLIPGMAIALHRQGAIGRLGVAVVCLVTAVVGGFIVYNLL